MAIIKPSNPISSTIAIIQAAINNYQLVKDDKNLGETFHEAGRGLSLINKTLSTACTQIHAEIPQAATISLESCNNTATLLESLFKEVSQATADARLQSYAAYIEKKGRGSLVETLVVGIMEHICKIATDCAIQAEMQDELTELRTAINKLKEMRPSVPIKRVKAYHFENHSNGYQFNAPEGNQYNAVGPAPQFNGSTFPGGVYFGHPHGQNS